MDAVADGRRIGARAGVDADTWRRWLVRAAPLPLPHEALLAPEARLVVVAPHPDDEVLACGGLLAWQAARGGAVRLVGVTDGDASHRGDPAWPPTQLAAARRGERARGLALLGLRSVPVVAAGLPDGAVAQHRDGLKALLRKVIGAGDVVVTTWRRDGHPDHDATGAAVAEVCGECGAGCWQAPVWTWQWSWPDDPRVPWHALRAFTLPPGVAATKARALAEHATQLTPRVGGTGAVLGADILARAAWPAEYFFLGEECK